MEFILILAVCLPILAWIIGEVQNVAWLRRIAVPIVVVVCCVITSGVTGLLESMSSSTRYSRAVKRLMGEIVKIADQDGDKAAINELRSIESQFYETYEGGIFLQMLSDPITKQETGSVELN